MKFKLALCAIAAAVGFTSSALAQDDFPDREIRIVVPWSPGGATDTMARMMIPLLEKQGVSAIVENLPGGGSAVGMGQVATSAPDGYTIGLASSSLLSLFAQDRLPFEHGAFADIVRFSQDPLMLLVRGDSEWQDLDSFIEHMRAKPGEVTIGVPGSKNVNHAMAGLTGQAAGVDFRHVSYPGGSRVIAELVGGQINAGVLKPSDTFPMIESGDLRPIGIFSNTRVEVLPDVETFPEAGYDVFKDGELAQISYLTGPAGMSPEVRQKLIDIFQTALSDPSFQEFSKKNGFTSDGLPGKELQAYNDALIQSLSVAAENIFE
ncbi:MAG: ABC transporter substrate-binding protein [Mameliella sp.]|nr:ABC transporter substrate-binding protein [Mameliella sp.]|tara:strand:+ start:3711 stop:4670 length:960 start_codon:yes stop_codon:yes gene_type:complete